MSAETVFFWKSTTKIVNSLINPTLLAGTWRIIQFPAATMIGLEQPRPGWLTCHDPQQQGRFRDVWSDLRFAAQRCCLRTAPAEGTERKVLTATMNKCVRKIQQRDPVFTLSTKTSMATEPNKPVTGLVQIRYWSSAC